ncbi:MAG: hydroxymethylglutaryl-CoA lyase [Bdellovibrionales bacterium]|nr:hydroxymethylglutaryl-CoA lyase [Bdellovibrionales bacterium]
MSRQIKVCEVGPRDGLQNQPYQIPVQDKYAWIVLLCKAGISSLEVTSFVHPQAIPQLQDAETLVELLDSSLSHFSVLIPNQRGLERFLACENRDAIDEIAVFTAASETFNQKNIRCSIDESFEKSTKIVAAAQKLGKRVRGYLSTAFYCPYEGKIDLEQSLSILRRLFELGCDEVSVGDTIGLAQPQETKVLFARALEEFPAKQLAGHFHDTYGMALSNVYACLDLGISIFDSSVGGIGGCPYAPGASGNLATEDLVHMLDRMGMKTGIDLEQLIEASVFIESKTQSLPSKVFQALRQKKSFK